MQIGIIMLDFLLFRVVGKANSKKSRPGKPFPGRLPVAAVRSVFNDALRVQSLVMVHQLE